MAALATPDELVAEARAGRMVILIDSDAADSVGMAMIPGAFADAGAITFMAVHCRGLVCLALDSARVRELRLPLMSQTPGRSSPFTISIEARTGVTTGISAADRARTVAVAIDSASGADDLVSPGHVFPLAAAEGGVLVRPGYSEASTDIGRMAGHGPAAVICAVLDDNGAMAKRDALLALADQHGLKVGTIRDLVAHRLATEVLVERIGTEALESAHGGAWELVRYRNSIDGTAHTAVVKQGPAEPPLVRVHGFSLADDLLASVGVRAGLIERAMAAVADRGAGAVVIIAAPQGGAPPGETTSDWNGARAIGIGAQILLDLDLRRFELLTTGGGAPPVLVEAYGLDITGVTPLR